MRRSLALILVAVSALFTTPSAAECPPANAQAIDLANEADRERATDLERAITHYEQASQLDPRNHRILHKLALAQTKKEEWTKVVDAEDRALHIAPTFATYAYLRGVALAHLAVRGQATWPEVKDAFERTLALDARQADAHYDLAEALLHLGDEKGALVHYTKAIQLRPTEYASWTALADLYIRLGLTKEAIKTLDEALTYIDGPKRFGLATLYGMVLDENGDSAGAAVRFEDAKKACGTCTEPGQQIAFFNLGMAYGTMRPPRKAEAVTQLATFLKLVCKGAAAQRYADQCTQSQMMASKLGGTLQ